MSITVEWYDETHSILRYTFSANWTLAELENAVNQCKEMLDSASHRVAVLMDYQQADAVPESVLGFGRRVFPTIHAQVGTIVVVQASPMFRSTYFAILRSIGGSTHTINFVETIEQALELIESRREGD